MRSKRGERQERIIFRPVPHGRAGHHPEMKMDPVLAIFRPAIASGEVSNLRRTLHRQTIGRAKARLTTSA
jgi:hypothetical protein